MLNVSDLEAELKEMFEDTIPAAFEQAWLEQMPIKSTKGNEQAKRFGQTISDILSPNWATRLAYAIDSYIKTGELYGTVITVGSPVTQTAALVPLNLGNPMSGLTPNTIGIK